MTNQFPIPGEPDTPAGGPTKPNNALVVTGSDVNTTNEEYATNPQLVIDNNEVFAYTDALIEVSYQSSSNRTTRSLIVGLFIDNVLVESENIMEHKDTSNAIPRYRLYTYTFTPGQTYNIQLRYGKSGGGDAVTVTVEYPKIKIREK